MSLALWLYELGQLVYSSGLQPPIYKMMQLDWASGSQSRLLIGTTWETRITTQCLGLAPRKSEEIGLGGSLDMGFVEKLLL